MFDVFLKIDGIPGESTDDKHKDWIEILSVKHGMTQPASSTRSSAGGATAERTNHEDYEVVKYLDKASPKIFESLCKGTHHKSVDLEFCRAGGNKELYMKINMEEVLISSVKHLGSSQQKTAGAAQGTGDAFPKEAVAFNYGRIKWTYTQQKRKDGSGGGNIAGGWDLTANKVWG